jgi:hypothetical protein
MSTSYFPVRTLVSATPPWLPAIAAALLASLLVPQGADWPAQLFRVELFRQEGFELWNGQWYSGHPTAGYSLLFPPLGAVLGITAVGIASVLVATVCFHEIARYVVGSHARLASAVFGLALVPNLVVGRITFGLGLAIGLAAVLALQRGRWLIGPVMVVVTPLASPVAGVFLALALAAWGVNQAIRGERSHAWRLAGSTALALAPIVATALVFPYEGSFDFALDRVGAVLIAGVIISVIAGRAGFRMISIGALIYLVLAVAVLVVPNPLGGNMWRLAMFFAVPMALMLLAPERRMLAAALAALGLLWAWGPAVYSAAQAHGDPSAGREFHQPLIDEIKSAPGPPGRVEIPFTENHWEALYVAAELPIARGWERQADRGLNGLFYEPQLSAADYRRWLDRNAVRWVALPQVKLDSGAQTEAALIARNPSWLEPVWSNENWRLYEVANATPMASPPARGVTHTPTEVAFTMPRRGAVHLRVHHSRHWSVTAGSACVARASDGMLLVLVRDPGRVQLKQDFYPGSAC